MHFVLLFHNINIRGIGLTFMETYDVAHYNKRL